MNNVIWKSENNGSIMYSIIQMEKKWLPGYLHFRKPQFICRPSSRPSAVQCRMEPIVFSKSTRVRYSSSVWPSCTGATGATAYAEDRVTVKFIGECNGWIGYNGTLWNIDQNLLGYHEYLWIIMVIIKKITNNGKLTNKSCDLSRKKISEFTNKKIGI